MKPETRNLKAGMTKQQKSEYNRRYRENNKEKRKIYTQEHLEEIKQYQREWQKKHPGYAVQKAKEWLLLHPEKRKEIERRISAKRNRNPEYQKSQRERAKRQMERLSDGVVALSLGMNSKDVPEDLMNAKRANWKLRRLLNQIATEGENHG